MFLNLRNFCSRSVRNFCTNILPPALILTSILVFVPHTLRAAEEFSGNPTPSATVEEPMVPAEYGRIIYQTNADAPQQIYIIGQSHRSAVTGRNSEDIIKVQAEIFRIGEWLIQKKNVGMLLPEGFFQDISSSDDFTPEDVVRQNVGIDTQTLKARLADATSFVNADMLLNANYNIPLGQVENEKLYRDICRLLNEANRESSLSVLSEIHGLQGERTAVMLQNIPDIVEEAYTSGRIRQRRAMFTIGLGHVGEIISFLRKGSLRPSGRAGLEKNEATLKLIEQGYGVTVILPRTLAENEQILRLARLDSD